MHSLTSAIYVVRCCLHLLVGVAHSPRCSSIHGVQLIRTKWRMELTRRRMKQVWSGKHRINSVRMRYLRGITIRKLVRWDFQCCYRSYCKDLLSLQIVHTEIRTATPFVHPIVDELVELGSDFRISDFEIALSFYRVSMLSPTVTDIPRTIIHRVMEYDPMLQI